MSISFLGFLNNSLWRQSKIRAKDINITEIRIRSYLLKKLLVVWVKSSKGVVDVGGLASKAISCSIFIKFCSLITNLNTLVFDFWWRFNKILVFIKGIRSVDCCLDYLIYIIKYIPNIGSFRSTAWLHSTCSFWTWSWQWDPSS